MNLDQTLSTRVVLEKGKHERMPLPSLEQSGSVRERAAEAGGGSAGLFL